MHSTSYADITPVSDRTSQVRDAIVAAVPNIDTAADVTETHLATITSLNLRAKSISALKSGDFSGLTGLTDLNLYGNQLSNLPNGIFEGLTALTTLRLGGNTVDPMPITVSLKKLGDNQFKAAAPTGAPFDIVLPISATNGSISDNATSITIAKGSTESNVVTVSRTADTTAAVTANIRTLPGLPQNHYGYTLSKSSALPVEIISEVVTTTPIVPEPVVPEPIEPEPSTNTAPIFTDSVNTIRTIAENTAANINIGSAVPATDADDDTLTYSLSGTDASSFSIDSTSGQLSTKTTLDYETKRVYTLIITVSDGNLTDAITVIISVIDVAETTLVSTTLAVSDRTPVVRDAIVAAVPNITAAEDVTATHLSAITALNLRSMGITALQSGDFAGLTGLTNLNLYGNMLSGLPYGIFEGLTALTILRLGGNAVDPLPISITLQQVAEGQFKAVIPTGAPFDVVVPVGAMMIIIPQGSMESDTFTADASVTLGALPTPPANHFGYILAKSDVCNRTLQVSEAITAAVPGITDCRNITEVHLATITSLNLSSVSITSLKTGDFAGMLSLTTLNLSGNQLTNLPDGIFADLTSLNQLNLSGNSVSPLPLTVSLQKVGSNQIKVVVPTGAPFDIVLQITVANGSLSDSVALTIPIGSVESSTQTITRTSGTTAAVTVDISSLPNLPSSHSGYALVKSNQQPLEIFKRINVAPIFTEGTTATRTIAENTTAGTNIGSAVSATDANNDTLTYKLSGIDAASFSIVSTTGQLKTKAALDYETKTSYSVTITVSDGNLTDTISVTINVTDIDETPPNRAPVFTDGTSTTRTIAENTTAGTNIGSAVSATDADDDTLTYTLSGTDAASFSIDSTSGQLQTKSALDYETKTSYSVIITVSDGSLTDTISVTINVTDVDETPNVTDVDETPAVTTKDNEKPNNAPVFKDGTSTTRAVAENTGSGVNIGSAVSATDADEDTLTYSLGGKDVSLFSIDSSSGQLRTRASLDYETKDSYSVTITVSDGNLTDTISVTINVTDVNETPSNNAPVFTDGSSTSRSIAENTGSGVNIGNAVSATDANNDTLTYTLSGTDAVSFSIDSSSGQLRTSAALDYETKTSYSVTVSVSDGSLSDSITVTINIIDEDETPATDNTVTTKDTSTSNNAPIFTDGESTTRTVAENTSSGVDIGSAVSAADEDKDDTLTYGLGGTDASSFSIDSSSGQLRTSAALDYETKTSYSVTITVSDGNLGKDTISVTINITNVDESPTNNAPIFTTGSTAIRSVAENTATDTNISSAITATDADNDTLEYTLGGTDSASFSIISTSGQLKTKTDLNYETKSSYTVTVSVSDGEGGSDSISVTINVTNVNEAPIFSDGASTTRAIAENVSANINIGTAVTATDVDKDSLTYTLSGTDATSFDIDSTIGQLKTKTPLDYETKTAYSVTITVSDGRLTDTITVTISVTNLDETPSNNAPVFGDGDTTTRTIAENTASGTNIGTPIAATDTDSNTLAYVLGGDDASSFSIDLNTGQLKTSATLDHETKSSYTVTVEVSDGSLKDTVDVTISVTDVNDAPVFTAGSRTRTIAENTAAGTNIGDAFTATDQDNKTLEYSLGGDDAASFDIGSTTGQLKTKAALDYETETSYSVTITASDGKKSDSIDVTITVTDVDENRAPAFASESTTRSVAENIGSGVNIGGAVSATDADDDTLEYTLGGTDADSFSIDSTTGQLRTNAALDFETQTSYSVTITASDGKKSDNIDVTITVTDVDENRAPAFASESTTRSVAENIGSGVNIGAAITATDADNDTLTYTLGGTDAASFDIVSTNGQLKTKVSLDFETQTSYSVTITASDGKKSDSITVTITVTDVDENRAPAFGSESTTRSVAENIGSGVNIGGAVSATDADDDTLEYTLGGTDADSFSIDSTTGQLRTNAALDFETQTSYSVTITASDGKKSDNIDVTITVTDVDENRAPAFASESTTRSVAENIGSGVNIGAAITATDADNDTLTYTLSGTDAASFDIVSTNGQLKTKVSLDFETQTSYSVTITASDGKKSDSIDVTITVTDVDENRAPAFGSESTTRSVTENIGSGVNIGGAVSATDADEDTLTYTLGGTDAASFDIVSTNGQLKTKVSLDFETQTSYSVTITASDGKKSDSITVTITVTDADENRAPTFAGSSISFSISDIASASVGDSIGLPITATDLDDDTLEYSLGGDDASKFTIDNGSGQLKVTQSLIDDSSTSYAIKVIATDPDDATVEISVTIIVTRLTTQPQNINSAPAFDDGTSTTRSIAENTASGENIGDPITATDSDTDDTLTYSLEGTDAASFSIVSTSGQLQTSAALDYENKNPYTVTVRVTDDSGASNNSATITVMISITNANNAPVFAYGDSVTLSVNKGERLGTSIRAFDDDDDTLEYSLGGTDAAFFSLDSTYEYWLKSNDALNYDGKFSYSVTITVSDGNGGSETIAVTITDPAPEVEIWTLIGYDEPDWVLKLDTETGIVSASLCDDGENCLFVTSFVSTSFVSFTRPLGVKFDNSFIVFVELSEEVSDFEQGDLTLTENTAGATLRDWQGPRPGWGGYLYSTNVDVTTSGSVTFNVAAGVVTDGSNHPNAAVESKTVTVTITLTEYPPWDVNEDGSVDATDSALVTAALGQTGEAIVNSRTDVNWDDTVDADDLTLVTYHITDVSGAPSLIRAFSILDKKTLEKLDPVTLQDYLDILRTESDGSPRYLRAIAIVESVLAAMRPNKTQLLTNYPNPFNPETWIPYHLANPSNVGISIYDMQGNVVRRLLLGHQQAGYYISRNRAAYWDGTNEIGERVSSGVYFYQLQTDNVSLLRKMLILK